MFRKLAEHRYRTIKFRKLKVVSFTNKKTDVLKGKEFRTGRKMDPEEYLFKANKKASQKALKQFLKRKKEKTFPQVQREPFC